MFDGSMPEPAELSAASDAELVGAIEGWTRASAASDARRLAAIAELARRRVAAADPERHFWTCDVDDSVAAEVSAAMNTGHGRAMNQLKLARLLDERLPRINGLLLAGEIPLKLVTLLRWRTFLVDEDVVEVLDAALAQDAVSWGPLSEGKVQKKIDFLISVHDPQAVRRLEDAARKRDITIGDWEDEIGTTSIWGRLFATDAAALKKRLDLMAISVCKDDPRTLGQRRADALGALGAGLEQLACLCGGPECPADTSDGRATNVVIHIVGDPSVLDAQPDPNLHGDGTTPRSHAPQKGSAVEPEAEPAAEPQPTPEPVVEPEPAAKPAQLRRPSPGIILGGSIVPAALLAELIQRGAKVQFVTEPGPDPENHYSPSPKLAEFVRMRDMTCRFPGCDKPADLSDIDHTLPWPYGATHPSEVKCYCRKHHHLKTFWVGDWADRQYPDGRVVVTSPTGKDYTTKPGAGLLFRGWNITTAPSPPTGTRPPPLPGFAVKMTRRKRTRAQDHAYRIAAERALNAATYQAAPF